MFELDGELVNIRDRVYDISNGYGEVKEVRDDTITVLFLNRRRISFVSGGSLNGVRRLFWHDPLVVSPPKDAAEWQHLVQIIVAVQGLVHTPVKR